jgi:hypothetical protein
MPIRSGPPPRLNTGLTTPGDELGRTLQAVARELEASRGTVRRHALRLGLGRRTRGTDWSFTDEVEQLRECIRGKPGRLAKPRD